MVHTDVVFEEGWSFIRGRKQCKPKHVSSGIVVLNVRWSLIRVVSQEGDYCTVVPLLRDHPVVHTDVVFEEGWSFIRGRKQCKPKHVSSGIVVLNVRWSLIRVVSQEGDYCIGIHNLN